MSASHPPHDFDRRHFLKLAGIAGISSLGAPVLALAQSKPAPGAPPTPGAPAAGAPADSAKTAAAKPPEISEDARALGAVIQRRYGQHLTPEQLEAVIRDIDGGIRGGRRMRDQKLANGDEPDFTFKA